MLGASVELLLYIQADTVAWMAISSCLPVSIAEHLLGDVSVGSGVTSHRQRRQCRGAGAFNGKGGAK